MRILEEANKRNLVKQILRIDKADKISIFIVSILGLAFYIILLISIATSNNELITTSVNLFIIAVIYTIVYLSVRRLIYNITEPIFIHSLIGQLIGKLVESNKNKNHKLFLVYVSNIEKILRKYVEGKRKEINIDSIPIEISISSEEYQLLEKLEPFIEKLKGSYGRLTSNHIKTLKSLSSKLEEGSFDVGLIDKLNNTIHDYKPEKKSFKTRILELFEKRWLRILIKILSIIALLFTIVFLIWYVPDLTRYGSEINPDVRFTATILFLATIVGITSTKLDSFFNWVVR